MSLQFLLDEDMSHRIAMGLRARGVDAVSVHEIGRQQIGMLRAIGFRRQMILRTFLLESSFVCLLGTLISVVLGLLLGHQVIGYFGKGVPGLHFTIPWLEVIGVVAITYLASLLTTYLPAWQASRIYPAQALRYE